MIQQEQPNAWSCLPTAFAMAMGVNINTFIAELGHDGSEIVPAWRDNPEPYNRKGFHIQEMIRKAFELDFFVIQIQPCPTLVSNDSALIIPLDRPGWEDYFQTMLKHVGVLTGCMMIDNRFARHAVAWDGTKIITPLHQRPLTLETFHVDNFYILEAMW